MVEKDRHVREFEICPEDSANIIEDQAEALRGMVSALVALHIAHMEFGYTKKELLKARSRAFLTGIQEASDLELLAGLCATAIGMLTEQQREGAR